jgi:hypothetical protein
MTRSEKCDAASSARWRLPLASDNDSAAFNAVLHDGFLLCVFRSARWSVGC